MDNAKGMAATALEKMFLMALGFAQGVVLARLLSPRDFGIFTMPAAFAFVALVVAEGGLGQALVALGGSASNVRELERLSFRRNLRAGVVCAVVLAATSPLVALWFGEKAIVPVGCAGAVAMALNALCAAPEARLVRNGRFGALSSVNAVSSFGGFLCGATLAFCGAGAMSIAALSAATAALRLAALALAGRRVEDSAASASSAPLPFRRLSGYGARLAASQVAGAAFWQSFSLAVAKTAGAAPAGLFARALRWSLVPGEIVDGSVSRVSFADLSRASSGGFAQSRRRAVRFLALNLAVLLPALAALCLFADSIVLRVLGERWTGCAGPLRILAAGAAARPVAGIAENLMKATGRAGAVLSANIASILAGSAILAAVCAAGGGIDAICAAMSAWSALNAAILAFAAFAPRAASVEAECGPEGERKGE